VVLRTAGVIALCCAAMLVTACSNGSSVAPPATTTVTVGASSSGASSPSAPISATSTPGKVFDSTAVAAAVQKILTDDYQIAGVSGVSCPDGQQVRDGAKFDCSVTVGGKAEKVTITTTGDSGDYQVGAPA
jgi:hypothetical protein